MPARRDFQPVRPHSCAGFSSRAEDFARLGLLWYAVEPQIIAVSMTDRDLRPGLLRRLRELRGLCPGLHPLAEPGGGAGEELTSREREIARLARAGVSDRAIADALGISVRTVNTRLARVYGKLEIAGRRELPSRLSE